MKRKFANFVDILRYQALDKPQKIVFTFLADGETESAYLTYQQLDQLAKAIATKLQGLQATGERALLLYQPGLEFISAFFGCLYAGVIAVPAYPPRANRSLERLQAIVADADAKLALTTQSLADTIEGRLTQSSEETLHCITTDDISPDLATSWQETALKSDQLAFLQYTSGSTGTPKGVRVSHGNLIHNSSLINRGFQDTSESKGVSWLPPYHDMGLIGGILQPIYVGASMALMPPVAFLQRPFRWLQAISHYRVTTSGAPNFAYDLCISQITPEQREILDLSCWELAFTGAEPIRAQTLQNFAQTFAPQGFRLESFYPCYGMAETTLIVSGGIKQHPPVIKTFDSKGIEKNQVMTTSSGEYLTFVGCGQAAVGKICIVNPDTLKLCASDEIGEIWVNSPSVAQGYWNRPAQTEATFNAYITEFDPPLPPLKKGGAQNPKSKEGPFLRTGDLGFLQEGELFVTGRLKDLIIIRGRNYYPQDIELTVENSHPALREGCGAVVSVEIQREERLVIVYEVKRSHLRKLNAQNVTHAIRKAVLENHELQTYGIVLLKTGSIPKTSSGKIQRHACKAGYLEGTLNSVNSYHVPVGAQGLRPQNYQLPENPKSIQDWLVQNIAQRIGVSPSEIDIREPLASYGLDSVQAVRLSAELEDFLGQKLSPTLAYDYPTIEALSQYLTGHREHLSVGAQGLRPNLEADKIAIIGIGCRFPGANNPQEFWQLLQNGKDAITNPKSRIRSPLPPLERGDSQKSKEWGGFLENTDLFDAQFFGISPREAQEIDPQQRLLLEVCWEALETGGISAEKLAGSQTGVFIGISSYDYSQIRLKNELEINPYVGTGNAHSIAANRLSYYLDLHGPSLSVDTACSSSLVAIHLASSSLQMGECNLAIAGGVNLILSPELTETFTKAGMMATDGHCKTFDVDADGYVRGEGCGIVVLKRFSEAIRDGNPILAVIRGSAINQDGRSNGLTAPNGLAQQAVIRQSLVNAGVEASEISYIETHGTGTALGDPIEVNSLKMILLEDRKLDQSLYLGSVKTNIGHLEAAAGVAGLIKVVLSLQNEMIPPHLHLKTLNPHIDLQETPIAIPTQLQPWKKGEKSRLAGVSSFGFGGTNAHLIVEEGFSVGARGLRPERPLHLLTLSAKNEPALQELVKNYKKYLTSDTDYVLAGICFTANTGRSHFNHRLAVIASSQEEVLEKLASFSGGTLVNREINPKIAFLFTGQGSQYVGMGQQLYQTQPTFKQEIDHCAEILQPLGISLLDVLYPDQDCRGARLASNSINETLYTQPAIFALEYALAQLWISWGIQPSAVMGHSVGEYVAACIAGVFSLEDGLKLITQRAFLMQSLPSNGEMWAIFADLETVKEMIAVYEKKITIAAINGLNSIVISGDSQALKEVIATLQLQGIKTRQLKVSHAFHSPLMQPIIAEFEEYAQQITYSRPKIDLISNLTGKKVDEEITVPQYWIDHILKPVQFLSSLEELNQQNYQIFLEIGSQPTLLGMGRSILEAELKQDKSYYWLPSLKKDQRDWQIILDSLAHLYNLGIDIDWLGFDKDYDRTKIAGLPTYPFQRQRYWITDNLSEIKQDWLYTVQWMQKNLEGNHKGLPLHTWLIFADNGEIGRELGKQLKNAILVYRGESYQKLDNGWIINPTQKEDYQKLLQEIPTIYPNLAGIVHMWSLEETFDLENAQNLGCRSILYLLQALDSKMRSQRILTIDSKISIVTRGTQKVIDTQNTLSIASSTVWGLGKVIALEYPQYWGGIIDLSPTPDTDEVTLLLTEITNPDGESQLAFRNGQRYVSRLEKFKIQNSKFKIQNEEQGTYLITGGLGSVGLKIVQWLAQKGVNSIVLVGRSNPSVEAIQTLQKLEQQGVNILIKKADVAKEKELSSVLKEIKTLRGVIHAAGVLDDGILQGLSWERFNKVLTPKVQGTWNLHNLTKDIPLDYFIMFSSAASLLGSLGQGNYAAANAFLDAIAYYRQSQGLSALTINWGTLSDGMATTSKLAVKGLNSIPTEEGLEILSQVIGNNTPQIGIVSIDWEEVRQQFPYLTESPYFQNILKPVSKSDKTANTFNQLLQLPSNERETFLVSYLQSSIARIIQLPISKISPSDSLLDLGMDSLNVMEAINQLKNDLQLMLYPREVYERPKIEVLARYLAGEFSRIYSLTPSLMSGKMPNLQLSGKMPNLQLSGKMPNPQLSGKMPNLQLSGKMPNLQKLPRIAFILSSPRSGSTLLRVMLGGHRELASPPELHLLPFDTIGQREKELTLSHLGEGLQKAVMELKGVDATTSQQIIEKWVQEDQSIPQVYQFLQELAGNRLLIDKSPTYAFYRETLDRAEAIFNNAQYIHLVRHPYAVIESFCRLRMDKLVGTGNEDPYQLAELIWSQSNQNIIDFLAQIDPKRHYFIRYEDLVTQPEQVMQGLCEFLGITFDASLLNPYEGERMTGGVYNQSMSVGDPNFLKRKQIDPKLADNWQEIQLPSELNDFSRRLANYFAYDLPTVGCVSNASPEISNASQVLNTSMQEDYINIRGLNFCLCTWGPKDGNIIFCLHGILEQGFVWHEMAIKLAEQGYHVIAPDLRGHGKSDHVGQGGSYNLLDFLGDIDGIINHLTDKPLTLVGHSFGSVLAAMYASIRPQKVKNLVLVETVIPAKTPETETAEQLITHLDYLTSPPEHPIFPTIATAAERLRLATPTLSESFAMQLAQRITEPYNGGIRWRWATLLRTRAGIEFNGIDKLRYLCLLKQIQAPITLVYGDKSNFNRPEDLAEQQQAMPNATKIVLSGGHNLPLETPEDLAKILLEIRQ